MVTINLLTDKGEVVRVILPLPGLSQEPTFPSDTMAHQSIITRHIGDEKRR